MKSIHYLSLTFIVFCFSIVASAQDAEIERSYRQYANEQALKLLQEKDKDILKNHSQIEREIRPKLSSVKVKKVQLAVVFHVLSSGRQEPINEEQIISQMVALNRDFELENNFIGHKADTLEGFDKLKAKNLEIQFCFPSKGPDGKNTEGIEYVASSSENWTLKDLILNGDRSSIIPWDPSKYINVWIVNFEEDIAGFAQRPGGPTSTDGIFISSRYVGTTGELDPLYNEGKTLTHLMGNYLGLHDLWGDQPCTDDYVSDTPVHNSPNYECAEYKHISTCSQPQVEMTMNFMDNTDDACSYMFTVGQMLRMHTMLAEDGPRNGLLETKTKCNIKENKKDLASISKSDNVPTLENPLVTIYPNPAFDQINLEIKSSTVGQTYIMIYDAVGNVVWTKDFVTEGGLYKETINSSQWSPGVYFIHSKVNDHSEVNRLAVIRN